MKNFFTVSQTAKIVGITAETLRHYDRIDLVKPCRIDEWTGYRYYSPHEIVILNTIKALRCMGLTLSEIKQLLAYDDFNKIIAAFKQAEKCADEKIAELNYAKEKIRRARASYENESNGTIQKENTCIQYYPQRVILLSDKMEKPTLDNLWNYHRHFYAQLSDGQRGEFSFEDLAGIYERNGQSRLFAVCKRYVNTEGVRVLPQGKYLCADCTDETRERVIEMLLEKAKKEYNIIPEYTIRLIVLSGILQWNYQIQLYISE